MYVKPFLQHLVQTALEKEELFVAVDSEAGIPGSTTFPPAFCKC